VHAVPGASAAIAALSVAGLPTDSFHFAGFLPPKAAARRRRLDELAAVPATLVLYETAPRLAETLADLGFAMSGREIAIAREITKRFEALTIGTLPLVGPSDQNLKGELVLLIGPPAAVEIGETEIREAIASALQRLSLRDAVDEVTRTLRVPRRLVYATALALQKVGP
jgi:16S rRNA (cytidine1402-2'-O)-methyltransferase